MSARSSKTCPAENCVGHKRDRDCSYDALSWADLDAYAALRLVDARNELHDPAGAVRDFDAANHARN